MRGHHAADVFHLLLEVRVELGEIDPVLCCDERKTTKKWDYFWERWRRRCRPYEKVTRETISIPAQPGQERQAKPAQLELPGKRNEKRALRTLASLQHGRAIPDRCDLGAACKSSGSSGEWSPFFSLIRCPHHSRDASAVRRLRDTATWACPPPVLISDAHTSMRQTIVCATSPVPSILDPSAYSQKQRRLHRTTPLALDRRGQPTSRSQCGRKNFQQ